MKRIAWLIFIFPVYALAQHKIDEYKASNGVIYHPGDTVKLGMGSAPDGSFRYLTFGGWYELASPPGNNSNNNVGRGYANTNVIIKKIVTMKWKGTQITKFVVGGGNITNYNLQIEEAIQTCEIKDCIKNQAVQPAAPSLADELAKLNKLYKDSVITKEEYDSAKKKLLK